MLELSSSKKNKVCLQDYNVKQDIENRLLMSRISTVEVEILEAILYSSIRVPIDKLAKELDLEKDKLLPLLEKLSATGLFSIDHDSISSDKEMRKYFETLLIKFHSDFKPGMEFLQGLLKKAPIACLPLWYSIPRTSNNIFDSIVEKYLFTPQIFSRYLGELAFSDTVLNSIVDTVYHAPDFIVSGEELREKYDLSEEAFEEHILTLEFHFVCCLDYQKIDDHWKEVVTPFYEWKEYLTFLRNTETPPLSSPERVKRKRPHDFSFIEDMSTLLHLAQKQPISLMKDREGRIDISLDLLAFLAERMDEFPREDFRFKHYVETLIGKACLLKLADLIEGRLYTLEGANDWLDLRVDQRALFLYRHPLNRPNSPHIPTHLCTERILREAEKCIQRVLNHGWVYFEDFARGVIVPLSEESLILLKRQGKTWKYCLPHYTEEEYVLIKAVVLEWLFEIGATAVGTHDAKECFCVTSFGQSLFGR